MRASRTHIQFTNRLGVERGLANDHLLIGSGVTIGDVDGDDRPDVFLARLEGPNALYRNTGGWRFEDVTAEAGLAADDRFSTGATFADVDGDGDLDLLTTALGGPNGLFLNDGTGVFRDATDESGLTSVLGSTTMTLADIDGDADLDLYVANYKTRSAADVLKPFERPFERLVEPSGDSTVVAPRYREHFRMELREGRMMAVEQAEPDRLYLNDGAGRFRLVTAADERFLDAAGDPLTTLPDDFGLAARFYDVDGDGDPDLYVCYDFEDPDQFWINDGSGRFRVAPPLALRTTSNASMAVDFSDIDSDGDVDFFVVDMLSPDRRRRQTQKSLLTLRPKGIGEIENRPQTHRNTLFMNRGDGTFAQIAELAGVQATDWSWGTSFLDVDLDGFEDILVANGHVRDMQNADAQRRIASARGSTWEEAKRLYPALDVPNMAFRNNGDLTFEDVSEAWGVGLDDDVSHGLAAGDLDGDGDTDVVINRLGSVAAVLRNDATGPRIAIRLRGRVPNTRGIGAKIRVESAGGTPPRQEREVTAGGMYLSGSDAEYAFAASEGMHTITVRWRSGAETVIAGVRHNRLYEVREAGAADPPAPTPPAPPVFEDVSVALDHVHVEAEFDDFARQPLVTNGLSRLGPGVAWYDVDGDDDPDLTIGAGRTGRPTLYRNDGGRFTPISLADSAAYDLGSVVALPAGEDRTAILFGQSSYEARSGEEATGVATVIRIDVGGGAAPRVSPAVPGTVSSAGPLAAADYDGDGDLDLFVGGRVVPPLYPLPATSRLFRNVGGRFEGDTANAAPLAAVGLVSGAAFADLDGDGDADLLLSRDWGSIVALENRDGRFAPGEGFGGLDDLTGRWNGITVADFDEDGRLDVVATNWGRNTRFAPRPDRPLVVWHADFDRNGTWDIVEAQATDGVLYPLASYDRLAAGIPFVRTRAPTFADFAAATLPELLGDATAGANRLEVETLDHTVFFNRGDRFEPVALPREAQVAPAFHAGVADYDGDGHDDLFLTQNFFHTDLTTPRYDAGRGLWLRGDGRGGLSAVDGGSTGIRVYGDQRGAGLADFDGDRRIDLVVTQNGAATRLYRNRTGRPGLRVRLVGPAGNPFAVGAAIRLVYADGRGPLRPVLAGAGYWSQDHPVPLLGFTERPRGLLIRWPDGSEEEVPIPDTAVEMRVSQDSSRRPGAGNP